MRRFWTRRPGASRWRRPHWATASLVILAALVLVLYATGRLELRWRPEGGGAHGPAEEKDGHAHGAGEEHGEGESRVSGDKAILDTEAIKAADIKTAAATSGAVAVTIQVNGEVRLPDERLAHVTARVPGTVREIHRARGDRVEAGGALLTLESRELGDVWAAYAAARTDLRLAEANLQQWRRRTQAGVTATADGGAGGWVELDQGIAEQQAALTDKAVAEQHLARMRELHDRGLRSRTELIAVEADANRAAVRAEATARRLTVLGTVAANELARARQREDAERAKLRALGGNPDDIPAGATGSGPAGATRVVVRSPIAGVVADRLVTVGESVEATAKVFSIADLSELWVTGAVYDKDVAAVRQGMNATVRVQGLGDAALRGQVAQIGPQVDEKTRTLPVRVTVRNQPQPGSREGWALRPGMFATVDLETSRKPAAVLVPPSAVQTLGGKDVVFVETALSEGAAFQRRPVKVGARDDRTVEITEGLQAGERVVVVNAYLIKSEFERSKISHGHAH